MTAGTATTAGFDGAALIRALDEQREHRGLNWNELADALHGQSSELNDELGDHGLCQGALVRTARRGTMSCQYALILLRWLGRPPEDFLAGPAVDVGDTRLPDAGPDRRLRWDLPRLYAVLDEQRRERGLTWVALGHELGCSPGRLTNLRTARLADMGLAMQVTQWVGRPAAGFVDSTRW